MHIEELIDEEVTALAGERYARKAPSVGGRPAQGPARPPALVIKVSEASEVSCSLIPGSRSRSAASSE